MNIPSNLHYTKSHEWVEFLDDNTAKIGITDHAQELLGDIVYINLPIVGDKLEIEEAFGDVESVKAVSEVYAPLSGTIAEVNESLEASPELVNQDAYDAWFIKLSNVTNRGELLSAKEYQAFVEKGE